MTSKQLIRSQPSENALNLMTSFCYWKCHLFLHRFCPLTSNLLWNGTHLKFSIGYPQAVTTFKTKLPCPTPAATMRLLGHESPILLHDCGNKRTIFGSILNLCITWCNGNCCCNSQVQKLRNETHHFHESLLAFLSVRRLMSSFMESIRRSCLVFTSSICLMWSWQVDRLSKWGKK